MSGFLVRSITGLLLSITMTLPIACNRTDETNSENINTWFVFNPEDNFSASVIDAGDWLDAPAGNHGFVQMKDSDFIFEDGTPVKFWGVNICSRLPYSENKKVDSWVKYLAKYGINAVRFHKFTSSALKGNTSTQLDPDMLKKMDYFCAQLRNKGIYYGWSPIYGHKPKPGDRDRIKYYDEIASIELPWRHLNYATTGIVNYAKDLQDLNIELITNMLNHRNPFTGLRYADDPALNFVELQNEDNIFWGALEESLKHTPQYRALLCQLFSDWLKKKYGSQEKLVAAWGGDALEPGENITEGTVYPRPNHHWYKAEFEAAEKEGRPIRRHYLDKARFLYEKQIEFYNRFVEAIRATGYKGPIVASCWQAGTGITHFYNLHADYRAGIVDRHNYFGGGQGHNIKQGEFRNKAMVSSPGSGLLSTGLQAVKDRPFALSEWMELSPTEWIAEGAPIIAVYGMGLQNWAASYHFANNFPHLTSIINAPNVYNVDSPTQIGLYPALARMIYRNDVEAGEIVSTRKVHIPSLYDGKLGFREIVEQEYDVKSFSGFVPQEALAAGRVVVEFTQDFEPTTAPDLGKYWYQAHNVIQSNTGQLIWDYSGKGFITVNTSGTKAVIGFVKDKQHKLGEVSLAIDNPFAVVFVTSLDKENSIADAKNILITTVARARNTGMKFNDDKTELLDVGGEPILLEPVNLTLSIDRPGTPAIHILDHVGRRTGKTISAQGKNIVLDGVLNKTLYYELEYE